MKRVVVMVLCCLGLPGCIFLSSYGASGVDDACTAELQCEDGEQEVCGQDGKTYGCESHATCLAVAIDDEGEACEKVACDPLLWCTGNLYCAAGKKRDADGCELCECACVAPPKIDCRFDEVRVCVDHDNDDCDDECTCVPRDGLRDP